MSPSGSAAPSERGGGRRRTERRRPLRGVARRRPRRGAVQRASWWLVLFLTAVGHALGACPPGEAKGPAGVVAALEPDLASSATLALSADARLILDAAADPSAAVAGGGLPGDVRAALGRAYGRPVDDGAGEAWLDRVADGFVTQAILVTEGQDTERAVFAAVHWPSPLAPRLRVVRIPPGLRGIANRELVLNLLGTCAVEVREWISAPEEVALRFMAEHVEAHMFVLGRAAATGEVVQRWVAPEDLIAALRFEDRTTADLNSFSAWFAGEPPGVLPVTRLLPHLRGSLGPGNLMDLYRSFGR